jgi:hypothetical protein
MLCPDKNEDFVQHKKSMTLAESSAVAIRFKGIILSYKFYNQEY